MALASERHRCMFLVYVGNGLWVSFPWAKCGGSHGPSPLGPPLILGSYPTCPEAFRNNLVLPSSLQGDSTACTTPPHLSPCTSLLAGDSGVLGFRTATGGGRGLLARVAITWPWAFNNSWGVTAWTCRLWAAAGAATLAEFTTHGSVPMTWEETGRDPRCERSIQLVPTQIPTLAGGGGGLKSFNTSGTSASSSKE